ncbi:MAG TPA: hypothetical protein VF277_01070 [Steroidobacteraceae bacterium]
MTELAGVLIALVLIVLAGWVVAALSVRAAYRRIRRSRAVNGAVLRTRSVLSRGLQHQVLRLRVRLDYSLQSARMAVELRSRDGGLRGETTRLFRRICEEGAALDAQLRLLESEIDDSVVAEELPTARDRVDQFEGIVRQLRGAVASGLGDFSDDALTDLRADVDREAIALQAGVQELHTLNRRGRAHGYAPPTYRQPATTRLPRGNAS